MLQYTKATFSFDLIRKKTETSAMARRYRFTVCLSGYSNWWYQSEGHGGRILLHCVCHPSLFSYRFRTYHPFCIWLVLAHFGHHFVIFIILCFAKDYWWGFSANYRNRCFRQKNEECIEFSFGMECKDIFGVFCSVYCKMKYLFPQYVVNSNHSNVE